MKILAPSILAADFSVLGNDIQKADKAGAEYIHIDVMDGVFVPSISFGMPVIKSIRPCTEKYFDVHLMIVEPERYIQEFVEAGADCITIHVEACDCIKETLTAIKKAGVKAGISLNPSTPLSQIEPYLLDVDLILVMTVNPGFGGQEYIEECTSKIEELRNRLDEKKIPALISVDGGVNKKNVQKVLAAGTDVVVAGSAVFRDDVEENVKCFLEQFKEFEEKRRSKV